ncbi:MAG: type I restriction enzyme HsdR N-terminal domain-containing protein [Prevotellaceae bacterium]|nr:type I restriction enzyme HsdR N-terminal domain-containing protein [Prevotellaceae bacterium]
MQSLNFPPYSFKIKKEKEKFSIFCRTRKRYVALTPEEWVRQHFTEFLITEKHYPPALLANEVQIELNGLKKRCDTVIYNRQCEPLMIVEYKAPEVAITQKTFDQIAVYNMRLNVRYLVVSNGLSHYCCRVEEGKIEFLAEIPAYEEIVI